MNSPITYHGGSNKVIPNILPLIPEHVTYCEPFAGGASVFFAKKTAKRNYLNDSNSNIAYLYSAMCNYFDELNQMIQSTVYDEFTFQSARRLFDSPIVHFDTDKAIKQDIITRGWAVWVISKMGFGGKLDCDSFAWKGNTGDTYTPSRGLSNSKAKFQQYKTKMDTVQIFNRDALEVIKMADSEDTFFYVDPPWIGTTMGHYKGYTKEDFKALIDVLSNVKGKFLLHTNKKVMQSFYTPVGWYEESVTKKSNQSKGKKQQNELFTFNYKKPFEQTKLF